MLLGRPRGSWLGSSCWPGAGLGMSAAMAASSAVLAATQARVIFLPAMAAAGVFQLSRELSPQAALRASA
ncbi:MAG: hypothetical protein A2Z90_20540 [Burkholderiales bacterium GWA2_64_37]|nr:MAG: hypothetical protein A2Z90_20540 [Burkholderiales bacterium GWA2_64_37]HCE91660.1 hypothetical protein [Acidovorax sp.]